MRIIDLQPGVDMADRLMTRIPGFRETLKSFQTVLAVNSLPTSVTWVFRDDTWFVRYDRLFIRSPVGNENLQLVAKVYDEGRKKGLVEVLALGHTSSETFATVWFPRTVKDEVQGWDVGLKLGVGQPCPMAWRFGPAVWGLLARSPAFERYQQSYSFIGTAKWAAA